MAIVARFDRALPSSGTRVLIGPGLRVGDEVDAIFGGAPPNRIGVASRHCYTIEAGRPRPVATPRVGARWRVAVVRAGEVSHAKSVNLRAYPKNRAFGVREAKALGC